MNILINPFTGEAMVDNHSGGHGKKASAKRAAGRKVESEVSKIAAADADKPHTAKHQFTTEEAAYAAAEKAQPKFEELLDKGQGVDAAMGANAVQPTSGAEFKAAIDSAGPTVIVGTIKGKKRAREKVEKYDGDWGNMGDLVRGTVAVDKAEDIPRAAKVLKANLQKKGWKVAELPDDRISNPTAAGYRDLSYKVQSPGGLNAEIQINTKSMIRYKEGDGHKLYEKQRSIAERAHKRPLTASEKSTVDALNKEMKAGYDKAWADGLSGGE